MGTARRASGGSNSPLKYSTGCVIAGMRCQNNDANRYFASREGLCPELGKVEECHEGIFQRTAKPGVWGIVVSLALACAPLCGCGDGVPYPHGTASGSVTIDGTPVPKGAITFSPAGNGPVTGASIVEGRYVCPKIPLGPHTVSFHAEAAERTQILDVANGVMRSVPKDILPDRYRSGVPAEIHAGENKLDFALDSSAGK